MWNWLVHGLSAGCTVVLYDGSPLKDPAYLWTLVDDLGITLVNVEGMTFGPDLPDGRRTLVLVSDDNFSETQVTQFLVFALEGGTAIA